MVMVKSQNSGSILDPDPRPAPSLLGVLESLPDSLSASVSSFVKEQPESEQSWNRGSSELIYSVRSAQNGAWHTAKLYLSAG